MIEKAIREQLGIEEGYVSVQTVIGDRIEIRFHPPEDNQLLRGILACPGQPVFDEETFEEAVERVWIEVPKKH
ncbi:MAG: AbrB family transcriptional regulator [Caldilinea sp.]